MARWTGGVTMEMNSRLPGRMPGGRMSDGTPLGRKLPDNGWITRLPDNGWITSPTPGLYWIRWPSETAFYNVALGIVTPVNPSCNWAYTPNLTPEDENFYNYFTDQSGVEFLPYTEIDGSDVVKRFELVGVPMGSAEVTGT